MQKLIFPQKIKKVCVLQRRACNKFKRNYLENYNDSEHAVKTKNAPFFMIFPNIPFLYDCNLLDWSFKLNFWKIFEMKEKKKKQLVYRVSQKDTFLIFSKIFKFFNFH